MCRNAKKGEAVSLLQRAAESFILGDISHDSKGTHDVMTYHDTHDTRDDNVSKDISDVNDTMAQMVQRDKMVDDICGAYDYVTELFL